MTKNKHFYTSFFKFFVPGLALVHLFINALSYDLLVEFFERGGLGFNLYILGQLILGAMLWYTHVLNLNFINGGILELLQNNRVCRLLLSSYYNWNILLLTLILNIGLFQLGSIYTLIDWGVQGAVLAGSYLGVVFLYQRYQRFCDQGWLEEYRIKRIIAQHNVWLM